MFEIAADDTGTGEISIVEPDLREVDSLQHGPSQRLPAEIQATESETRQVLSVQGYARLTDPFVQWIGGFVGTFGRQRILLGEAL